jgi:hypothetical protein
VNKYKTLITFAAICAALGKNEAAYAVPETATNSEKVAIRMKRVKLIAKAFNGKDKPSLANTSQRKYYPCYWINQDEDAPGGFRLSFLAGVYVSGCSDFGVRPYYLTREDSDFAGKTFKDEYEALLQAEELANMEED